MSIQLRTIIPPLGLPAPFDPRPDGPSPWLEAMRQRLRRRLRNPTLRTLTIVDLDLLPHGDAFWAPATIRTAVVTLPPGLCGCDTVAHLTSSARAEFIAAIAATCQVDRVVLRRHPALRTRLTDGLVVAGFLGASLGLLGALPVSLPLVCGVAACSAVSAHAGYAFAPPEP